MKKKVQMISISEVEERINSSEAYIFDVTSAQIHSRHRIPGACYVEMPFTTNNLPEDIDATLIFYSHDAKCRQSKRAAAHAAGYGYRNVFIMKAGIEGWIYGQKPVEFGNPSRTSKNGRPLKRRKTVEQI